MYRRSVATGVKQEKIRKVDALVAFSNLKVTYGYTALTTSEAAPLTGSLILTTDELVARLSMSLVKNPESVDMAFEFLQQVGTESLTVEGPANRMISQFNFLLERHIIAIMSNTVIHNIKMLSTISRCVPILVPFNDSNEIVSEESTDIQETYIENQIIKGNENDGDENFEENINIDNDNKDNFTADYVLWKKDSVELEFPPKEGSEKKQKMFIKYNENFALGKINNKN
ncbi:unnamed protein product [Leptosia nina]|uniref:Uncharacterized protein n=1 Tax=Leptosia nina TaxID=320188 RepID=A0AAV1JPS1_9NEOP